MRLVQSAVALLALAIFAAPILAQPITPEYLRTRVGQSRRALDSAAAARNLALALGELRPDVVLVADGVTYHGPEEVHRYFAKRWPGSADVEVIRSASGYQECMDGGRESGTFTAYYRSGRSDARETDGGSYALRWRVDSAGSGVASVVVGSFIRLPNEPAIQCDLTSLRRFAGRRIQIMVEYLASASSGGPENMRDRAIGAGWTDGAERFCSEQPGGVNQGPEVRSSEQDVRMRLRIRAWRQLHLEATQEIGKSSGCVSTYRLDVHSMAQQRVETQERSVLLSLPYRSLAGAVGIAAVSVDYRVREDSITPEDVINFSKRRDYQNRRTAMGIVGQIGYTRAISSRFLLSVDARIRRGARLPSGPLLKEFTVPALRLDRRSLGFSLGAAL